MKRILRERHVLFLGLALGGFFPFAAAQEKISVPISTTIDVRLADLLAQPVAANWSSYNGDYSGRRYSALKQITPENVNQLRAQWVFHVRESTGLEVTPLVIAGIMFVSSANDAYALDARTGRWIWHYSRPVSEGLIDDAAQHHSRGVGLWHSHVYLETDNAHLLCLDTRSGHLLWDVPYAEGNKNYGATSAPLVVKDKVIVGTSGGDDEMYLRGGGTTWMPGTYDTELDTLYWGTSNPAPDFDGAPRPGDDLYTDCVLALDPETGKLKWYFQFTPHDLFDYDATETPVIVDAAYRGQPRKLLLQADRNGFMYVLDRTDGKFLSAVPFVKQLNWAKAIDAQGRPILTGIKPSAEGSLICPGFSGATNWYSPAYNPDTHLFYFLALEDCGTFFLKPESFAEGRPYYATGVRRAHGTKREKSLVAYNLDTAAFEWRYPQAGEGDSSGGVMTTAGGLVFFGDDSESFEAVDAKSGKPLWHFTTGQKFHASPVSYEVVGKQYVAVASGNDIFTFALP